MRYFPPQTHSLLGVTLEGAPRWTTENRTRPPRQNGPSARVGHSLHSVAFRLSCPAHGSMTHLNAAGVEDFVVK